MPSKNMPVHLDPNSSHSRLCNHEMLAILHKIQHHIENMYMSKDGFENKKRGIDVNNHIL